MSQWCSCRCDSGVSDHDDERVALEEPRVQVRYEADRKGASGGGDIVLTREFEASEMVGGPSQARNGDKERLTQNKIDV